MTHLSPNENTPWYGCEGLVESPPLALSVGLGGLWGEGDTGGTGVDSVPDTGPLSVPGAGEWGGSGDSLRLQDGDTDVSLGRSSTVASGEELLVAASSP